MKTSISMKRLVLVIATICFVFFASAIPSFAADLDDLGGSSHTTTQTQSGSSDSDGNAVSDYLTGYTPVTSENMQKANEFAGPVATAIGTITGAILVVVSAGIFLVTALDLAYIGIPFLRKYLNPDYEMQTQAGGGAPMMSGGYGMRGGMMGGMMGGGMQQQPQSTGRHRLVSDEAVLAVSLAQPQQQAGSPAMGGGMMGGMGMGGMMGGGMQQPQQQQMPTKSVAFTYLKKRMFFIIIFTVCTIILTSSVLTDCGINLAELLGKIITKLNGSISGISM